MICSIYLKTESCDGYRYLKDVSSEQEMVEYTVESMGSELAYVYDHTVSCMEGDSRVLERLLQIAISNAQEEDAFDV